MRKLNGSRLAENLTRRAAEDLRQERYTGVSLLVEQEGEPVFSACFGAAALNTGKPMEPETLFRLASMTKPVTAAAIGILSDRGLLSPGDPVARYLPEFADVPVCSLGEDGSPVNNGPIPVTLRISHLLTHTSGLGSGPIGDLLAAGMTPEEKASLADTVSFWAKAGAAFVPGTEQQYSGTAAFDVLARIIELVSGISYPEFLQRELFAPLGMTDTTFVPSPEQWQRLAEMHDRQGTHSVPAVTRPGCVFESIPVSHPLGGAGLVSSRQDYARFIRMLADGGRFGGRQLLSPEWMQKMASPQVSPAVMPGSERWGYGVRVITGDNVLPRGTFGWSGAYGTHFWIDPENRITTLYLKNSRYDGGSGASTARRFEADVMASLD